MARARLPGSQNLDLSAAQVLYPVSKGWVEWAYVDRRYQSTVCGVESGWHEGLREWVIRKIANLFVQGELVVVKSWLSASASRTRRNGCVWPNSTMQKISWQKVRRDGIPSVKNELAAACGAFDNTAVKRLP